MGGRLPTVDEKNKKNVANLSMIDIIVLEIL